jgi:hypothetical protein
VAVTRRMSSDRMFFETKLIRKDVERSCRGLIKALAGHLPGGAQKTTEIVRQNNNNIHFAYKS